MGQQETFEKLTNSVIQQLENGKIPWAKPWVQSANLQSNRAYRGMNAILLSITAGEKGYSSPFWTTFKAAQEMGGCVRKGEKSTFVSLWTEVGKKDDGKASPNAADKRDRKSFLMCKTYSLFNLDQVDGIATESLPKHVHDFENRGEVSPIENAEKIIAAMPNRPSISTGGQQATYSPSQDSIVVPARGSFSSPEEYYSTLFHELAHSTGHESRLNRFKDGVSSFGTTGYSKEELVAEFSAAFSMSEAGIEHEKQFENSASYVANWLSVLKDDRSMLMKAGAAAGRATDYIMGRTKDAPVLSEEKSITPEIEHVVAKPASTLEPVLALGGPSPKRREQSMGGMSL